jgi:hypothetical protein
LLVHAPSAAYECSIMICVINHKTKVNTKRIRCVISSPVLFLQIRASNDINQNQVAIYDDELRAETLGLLICSELQMKDRELTT